MTEREHKRLTCYLCRVDGDLVDLVPARGGFYRNGEPVYRAHHRACNRDKARAYRATETGKLRVREAVYRSVANHKLKQRARVIANKTVPIQPCEVCGSEDDIARHHDDYSKPLEVRFLCRKHHGEVHRQINSSKRINDKKEATVWHKRKQEQQRHEKILSESTGQITMFSSESVEVKRPIRTAEGLH